MPLSKHFSGRGEKVMSDMKKRYGERAEEVFYATENKQKHKASDEAAKHVFKRKRDKGEK